MIFVIFIILLMPVLNAYNGSALLIQMIVPTEEFLPEVDPL